MAHNIGEHDKQQGAVVAWHGLTEVVEDLSLDNNWLRTWEPVAVPVFIQPTPDSEMIALPFRQLVVSDKEGVLIGQPYNPETFRPLTNAEFLGMVKDAVAGAGHKLVSIGTIRNRGRRFASFNIERLGRYTAGGRTFEQFLNFGDGLDKSSVLWGNSSNRATVCDNTFTLNLVSVLIGGTDQMSVWQRHTPNIVLRLPQISDLIDKAMGVQREFAEAFEELATTPCSRNYAERVYAGFVAAPDAEKLSTRSQNIVGRLTELFQSGRGNRGESRADLFSGATEFYTHEASGNGRNRARQFESSEFGFGAQRKVEFWKVVRDEGKLMDLAGRGSKLLAVK